MYREITEKLALWREKADRQPVLITGAKAVGKTTVIKEFAAKYYKKLLIFDLRKDTDSFIYKGELLRKKFDQETERYLDPGENKEDVLIVFDHLDMEPAGTHSISDIVRFIVYNLMDYNVCMITSLNEKKILSPGLLAKLDIFSMEPVSLKEFFIINNDRELLEAVKNNAREKLSPEMLEKIRRYIKVYFITGGMPKVIQTYMDTRNLDMVNEARREIYELYLSEINSIAEEGLRKKARQIFSSVPFWLDSQDKKFRYGLAVFLTGKGNWEKALDWLTDRKMLIKTEALREVKKPLEDRKDKDTFKLYYNDIGILTYAYGIQFADIVGMDYPYELKNHALMEQFVLQQLLVSEMKGAPYYWVGSGKESIEFICESQDEIIPVKVDCENRGGGVVNEYRDRYHPGIMIFVTKDLMEVSEPVIKIPSFSVWNL